MANGQHAGGGGQEARTLDIGSIIIRVVVAAVVLAITAFFTPGFTITGIGPLIIAAIVLAALDYLVSFVFRVDVSPLGRGLTGFILAAIIIYATQYFVTGYTVSFFGALIGALIFGLVDYIIPGKAM